MSIWKFGGQPLPSEKKVNDNTFQLSLFQSLTFSLIYFSRTLYIQNFAANFMIFTNKSMILFTIYHD